MSVKEIPDEYVDYILCEKFHCLPSELDKQDFYTIQVFLEIMGFENEKREREYKRLENK